MNNKRKEKEMYYWTSREWNLRQIQRLRNGGERQISREWVRKMT